MRKLFAPRGWRGLVTRESIVRLVCGLSSSTSFLFLFVGYSGVVIAMLSTSVVFSRTTLSMVLALETVVNALSPRDRVDNAGVVVANFLLLMAVGMMKQYN